MKPHSLLQMTFLYCTKGQRLPHLNQNTELYNLQCFVEICSKNIHSMMITITFMSNAILLVHRLIWIEKYPGCTLTEAHWLHTHFIMRYSKTENVNSGSCFVMLFFNRYRIKIWLSKFPLVKLRFRFSGHRVILSNAKANLNCFS